MAQYTLTPTTELEDKVLLELALAVREPWYGCRFRIDWTPPRPRRPLVSVKGIGYPLSRAVMAVVMGEAIGPEKVVDHLCGNDACFEPLHLEIVPNRENKLRSNIDQKGRMGAINLSVMDKE